MYQLTSGTSIIRLDDGATIPADPNNSDYREYLAWIAAGNIPQAVTIVSGGALIYQQIAQLEMKQTDRMIREALTNATNVFSTGSAFAGLTSAQALAQIQSQIATLRAQLTSG